MNDQLEKLRDIAKQGGSRRIDGHTIDSGTAEAIVKTYDHLNGKNQRLFADLPLDKKAEMAFKLIKSEINEQEGDVAQTLSQIANDPQKRTQMIRALQQAGNKPNTAGQNQQGQQNQQQGSQQSPQTTQANTQTPGNIGPSKPTGQQNPPQQQAQTGQLAQQGQQDSGEEVDPEIEQALQRMNFGEGVECEPGSPVEDLNPLRYVCAQQLARDDQLRAHAGRRLGNMVDFNLGDYSKREALELFCNDPERLLRGLIMQYGDPAGWSVKVNPDQSALVIANNGDAVVEWISNEHGEQLIQTARDINKHNTLSENKRSKIMRMPKELKESIKTFNVSEKEFSDAIQRRLRNARQNMNESDYADYKSKLVEHATNDPRKFVAFIGASDKKLAESYRGFSRLRKTITEGKKPSVRGTRKKVSETSGRSTRSNSKASSSQKKGSAKSGTRK